MSLFNAIVDDRDTSLIRYGGAPWNTGGIEGEYSRTTTGTKLAGATATFTFYGTSVEIISSLFQGQGPLNFTYILDSEDPIAFTINNSTSRSPRQTSLLRVQVPDGNHVLTVELQSPAPLHWWVDYMVFTTTTDQLPKLPKTVLALVDDADTSQITYTGGWTAAQDELREIIGHTEHIVSLPGSTAVFKFRGTYIAVYGSVPTDAQATSTYTIDDGTPTSFTSPIRGNDLPGQKLFETGLSDGEHTLLITLMNSAEYHLDYIIYRPSGSQMTSPSASVSGSGSLLPSTSSSTSPQTASGSGTNVDAIVGGVVGGVVGLAVIFLLAFIFLRKKPKKEHRDMSLMGIPAIQSYHRPPELGPLMSPASTSSPHLRSQTMSVYTTTTGRFASDDSSLFYSQPPEREVGGGVRLMGSVYGQSEVGSPEYRPHYST